MANRKYVIIPAGGKGMRMGSEIPKQFLEIGGKPILRHTVEKFLTAVEDLEIILAIHSDFRQYWKDYNRTSDFLDRYILADGGITRFHTVQNALKYVPAGSIVAIHDAVRPIVGVELIRRLFTEAETYPAVVPAVPVVDSLREISGNSSSPVDRSRFVCVQTPQVFQADVLKGAYSQAYSQAFTDDASVAEAYGCQIRLVPGEKTNIKITTREDLSLASALLCR